MPADITQRLGFDASGAIQELVQLRQELQNFKQSLQNVAGGLRKFPAAAMPAIKTFQMLGTAATSAAAAIQSLAVSGGVKQAGAAVTSSFNQAETALRGAGVAATQAGKASQAAANTTAKSAKTAAAALNKVGEAGKNAGKEISISWKTIARVIQAQVIVRAVSALTSAFRQAHDAARDFSVAIAEIDTLAEGALGSTQAMSAAIRELAQNLGSDAADVAAGVYQTLSNQVVTTGESLEFTAAAAKLAIATQSELGLAVDALSSIMNSYNLEASEAAKVSDVLFRTVDLGRLRLEEFGAVLGRVSPLTAALGISYLEMSAAIAALTQKGVPAHTAITQLLQITQKLLRPTEKLMALYDEWGVETGAAAIKRFGGLRGVLLKMKDATAGNDTEFANLLGTVRAVVGALNLAGNEADALDDAMRQMAEGVNVTADAFDTIRESSGRKSIEAWNNLNTAMLEVGDTLLGLTTPLAKALKVILDNMKSVIAVAATVGVAFIALKVQAAAGAAGMGVLSLSAIGVKAAFVSMLPVIAIVAAALAAVEAGKLWADWADSATENGQRIANAERALTAEHARNTKARIEATRKEFAEQNKFANRFFTELSQQYRKDVDTFETHATVIGKVLDNTLDNLMKKRADAIKIVKDAVLAADDAIKASSERQVTAQGKLDELQFKRRINSLSKERAARAVHQRAEQTAARAKRAFAAAGANEESQAAARKLSQLAEIRAAEDASYQEALGNIRGVKKAEKGLEGIYKARIAAEKSFQTTRAKLRDSEHKAELARIEEAGAAVEVLLEKLKGLADTGGKTSKQILEDTERFAALLPTFAKHVKEAFGFDAFKSLGLPEGLDKLKFGVADAIGKAKVDWSAASDGLRDALLSKKYEVPVTLKITDEGIIEQIEAKFGEIDPGADPGTRASQTTETLQDMVNKTDTVKDNMDIAFKDALDRAKSIVSTLKITTLLGPWEKIWAAKRVQRYGESTKDYLEVVKAGVPELEALRQKILSLGAALEQNVREGRPLTEEQKTAYTDIWNEASRLETLKLIGDNAKTNLKLAIDKVKELGGLVRTLADEQASLKGIPTDSVVLANKLLEEQLEKTREAVLTEELFGAEKDETNTSIERSIETQKQLNESIDDGVTSVQNETTAVKALADAYDAAAQSASDRWEITIQPDVAGRPGITEEEGATPADGLAAQAAAAQQLQAALQLVNTEFANVVSSASGLTTAVSAPLEPATQLRDAFAGISQAVAAVSAAIPLVTGQLSGATATAHALTSALNQSATAVKAITQASTSMAKSISSAASAGDSMAASMNAAAAAAVRAARACAEAARQCSGGSVRASTGGRFFANGGRGTDTIPAMLTPGEFVVNAKSARNFFPQLQAINAGQTPVFRESGGQVTNIGDVNVTVQNGETPTQTVRDIANGLRRELRRKTVRLY